MSHRTKFQGHCRFCFTRPEADTYDELLATITAHEKDKHADRLKDEADRENRTRTGPVKMEDFYA